MQVKNHACLALQPHQLGWRCEYNNLEISLEGHQTWDSGLWYTGRYCVPKSDYTSEAKISVHVCVTLDFDVCVTLDFDESTSLAKPSQNMLDMKSTGRNQLLPTRPASPPPVLTKALPHQWAQIIHLFAYKTFFFCNKNSYGEDKTVRWRYLSIF